MITDKRQNRRVNTRQPALHCPPGSTCPVGNWSPCRHGLAGQGLWTLCWSAGCCPRPSASPAFVERRSLSQELTPSVPWCYLKTANKSAKFETLNCFCRIFTLSCKRIFIETHSIESRCYRSGKDTVCRRVRVSFNPKMLQAGAEKGLNLKKIHGSYESHWERCTTNSQLKVVPLTRVFAEFSH